MKIPPQIAFRKIKRSEALMSNLHERIAWLEHFSDQIMSCHIIVEKPHNHHRQGNLFHVRINLRLPGAELIVNREPSAHKAHKDLKVTIHDAFDETRRKLEDYVRKHRQDIKHVSTSPHAYVVHLVEEDGGYGFIRTTDNRELYFHSNAVLKGHYDQLKLGSVVKYAEEMGEKGPQASTVILIKKESQM